MTLKTSCCLALLCLFACGDKSSPETQLAPAAQPPPPSAPPPAPVPSAPNPCDNAAPIKLELSAGSTQQTPWDLELRYVVDEDKKLGPGYLFQLRSGERRWETRRDVRSWSRPLTWRGFCWRGADKFPKRALQLKLDVAPVCKDGELQELGGCEDALGPG
jgi:hypothetical protein